MPANKSLLTHISCLPTEERQRKKSCRKTGRTSSVPGWKNPPPGSPLPFAHGPGLYSETGRSILVLGYRRWSLGARLPATSARSAGSVKGLTVCPLPRWQVVGFIRCRRSRWSSAEHSPVFQRFPPHRQRRGQQILQQRGFPLLAPLFRTFLPEGSSLKLRICGAVNKEQAIHLR